MDLSNFNSFVFTADNHITETVWANRTAIRYDTYVGFTQVIDYCVEQHKPLVIGGDLFDKKRPDTSDIMFVKNQLSKMKKAELPVLYIPGNHDAAIPSWGDILDMYTLDQRSVPVGKFLIYGIPYLPASQLEAFLGLSEGDILVCHQYIDLFCPPAYPDAWNMKAEWVPECFKYVLAGDIHSPLTKYYSKSDIVFQYPGPTAAMSVSETQPKQFLDIDLSGDEIDVTAVPVVTRVIKNLSAYTDDDLEEIIAEIQNYSLDNYPELIDPRKRDIQKAIFKVKFYSQLANADLRLKHAAEGKDISLWISAVNLDKDDTELVFSASNVDVESTLKQFVDKQKEPELHEYLVGALECVSIHEAKEFIRGYRHKYGIQDDE